jgi:hypothetical protein
MTEEIHKSALYEAATNALASDASSDNTWTKMVTASFVHVDASTFKRELRLVEKQIKAEYKIGSMPVAWRGAKSIVLASMLLGISLTDANGVIKGKTAVQAAIKGKKVVAEPDLYTQTLAKVEWVATHFEELLETEKEVVKAKVKGLWESIC